MEDRYKFRLFDKSISEMSYNVCIGFIKDGVKKDWVCADTTCGQITYTDEKLNDIVLMQCTGLKDKNGKLIYEGDICITDDGETAIIEWNNYNAIFGVIIEGGLYTFDNFFESDLEIIGNIYENPELLED